MTLTRSIRPLTTSERLEAVGDYRKAAHFHRTDPKGNPVIAQRLENLADGYDPYYIQVDLVDDQGDVVVCPDQDIDEGWEKVTERETT